MFITGLTLTVVCVILVFDLVGVGHMGQFLVITKSAILLTGGSIEYVPSNATETSRTALTSITRSNAFFAVKAVDVLSQEGIPGAFRDAGVVEEDVSGVGAGGTILAIFA